MALSVPVPINHPVVPGESLPVKHVPLGALLGGTRAGLAVRRGRADHGELAQVVGVLPSVASRHTWVLRDAGLTTGQQIGSTVLHTQGARPGHPRGPLGLPVRGK